MKKIEELSFILQEASKMNSVLAYRNVLCDNPNYRSLLECQFLKLYDFTDEYKTEMNILIRHLNTDFVGEGCNLKCFLGIFDTLNSVYSTMNRAIGGNILGNFDCIINYIEYLARYAPIYNPYLDANYFENLIDELQLEGARKIIDKQWDEIYASKNGYKSFIEIFDDIFTNCLETHSDKFFYSLSDNDVMCRAIQEDNISLANTTQRFIPWPNAGHSNRWNPAGVTFLYLSFDKTRRRYNKYINLAEYVALLETRSKPGEFHSFCYFKPKTGGKILDLSYNDVTLRQAKNILNNYQQSLTQSIIEELLATPNAVKKYKKQKNLKIDINKKMKKYPIEKNFIKESVAKQYLIMICNCIYKKVDETDDLKLDMAYKSFRILAEYLKNKGVTGIIFPCTRSNKVKGKNLVLFDKDDAIPIKNSIWHIMCKEETFEME